MKPEEMTEDDLHAYVDNALTPAQRARVEAHLAACPEDALRVRAWSAVSPARSRGTVPCSTGPGVPSACAGPRIGLPVGSVIAQAKLPALRSTPSTPWRCEVTRVGAGKS